MHFSSGVLKMKGEHNKRLQRTRLSVWLVVIEMALACNRSPLKRVWRKVE
jgi:hypothetical protein